MLFRSKWMQQELNTCIESYNNPANRQHRNVKRGFNRICNLAKTVRYVEHIWPDCPVDYYQSRIDQLLMLRLNHYNNHRANDWLREHMPVASFFHIIDKYCEEELLKTNNTRERLRGISEDTGLPVLWFTEWNDTLSMLCRILTAGNALEQIGRAHV